MTRVQFTDSVRRLLNFCFENGIEVMLDWVRRSPREQEHLVRNGRSKTLRSKHLSAKAVDLLVVRDGKFLEDGPEYEAMGAFWKSLGPGHTWGGDWSFRDVYHFEVEG